MWHWSVLYSTHQYSDMHTSACFKIVNKSKISKLARFKFKDFSKIFKYFQAPYLFSSTFKVLEVFTPNSIIFKDFSSTLWTLVIFILQRCEFAMETYQRACHKCRGLRGRSRFRRGVRRVGTPRSGQSRERCLLSLQSRWHRRSSSLAAGDNDTPRSYVFATEPRHEPQQPSATTHTHIHIRLTALCPGLPGWAGQYQKGKTNLEFIETKRQWVAVASAGPYASLHPVPDSTPPLSFLQARMPFLPPNQQRQSTEGSDNIKHILYVGKTFIQTLY